MAQYTPNLGLYKPNRNDAEEVDVTLSENFSKIDTEITSVSSQLADMATVPNSKDLIGLQNAINKANGILHLPPGDFILDGAGTELLLVDKPLKIKGSGHNTRLIIKPTVPNTTDVIRISPLAGTTGKTLYSIEDLQIVTESGTPARHGIHIDVTNTGQYLSKFTMKNVIIHPLGGKAFKLTNPSNVDGFFTSTIRNNFLYGGMELQRIGDSVTLKENTITGKNTGIDITSLDGACQIVIENNNITSEGGAIKINVGDQVKILRNQIEQVSAYTGSVDSCVYLNDTPNAEVVGNNITAHNNVAHNVRVAGYRTLIAKNTMRKGTAEMVRVDASANRTDISYDNYYISQSESEIAPSILDNGVGTMGVAKDLTLVNGYVGDDTANFGTPSAYKDSNGIVHLKGKLVPGTRTAGTLITTLPTGFRPEKALSVNVGYRNYTSAKLEIMTLIIDPSGTIVVESQLDTARIDLDGVTFKAL